MTAERDYPSPYTDIDGWAEMETASRNPYPSDVTDDERGASGGTYASSIAWDEALLFQERFVPRDGHEVGFDFRDHHRASAWLHN